jgi:hypothetical protein
MSRIFSASAPHFSFVFKSLTRGWHEKGAVGGRQTWMVRSKLGAERTSRIGCQALKLWNTTAWRQKETERFPSLFMAMDAIFGDVSAATQVVVNAISPIMGPEYVYDRLKRLLSLRASVIHGGAPDVCESDNYHVYHVDYGENPIHDLELIVARCFQSEIFRGTLKERPRTYANLMRKRTGHIIK